MAVVTLTTALTLSGLIVKIKLLRRKVKDTDNKFTAMLDQVVDILEQLRKMEDEGVCLRSHEIDENIRTIHELRDELEQYIARTMVGKAFRQSKTETCVIDLDLTLKSLVKTHGDMRGLNGIEVMRRISMITQAICVALDEEKISTHPIHGDQLMRLAPIIGSRNLNQAPITTKSRLSSHWIRSASAIHPLSMPLKQRLCWSPP